MQPAVMLKILILALCVCNVDHVGQLAASTMVNPVLAL